MQFSPRHPNAAKAINNWNNKNNYLHTEIFKYTTYIEALNHAAKAKAKIDAERAAAAVATADGDRERRPSFATSDAGEPPVGPKGEGEQQSASAVGDDDAERAPPHSLATLTSPLLLSPVHAPAPSSSSLHLSPAEPTSAPPPPPGHSPPPSPAEAAAAAGKLGARPESGDGNGRQLQQAPPVGRRRPSAASARSAAPGGAVLASGVAAH
jgi:hypothetical protein